LGNEKFLGNGQEISEKFLRNKGIGHRIHAIIQGYIGGKKSVWNGSPSNLHERKSP